MLLDAYETGNPKQMVTALADHFTETERVVREGFEKQQHAARFGPVKPQRPRSAPARAWPEACAGASPARSPRPDGQQPCLVVLAGQQFEADRASGALQAGNALPGH